MFDVVNDWATQKLLLPREAWYLETIYGITFYLLGHWLIPKHLVLDMQTG